MIKIRLEALLQFATLLWLLFARPAVAGAPAVWKEFSPPDKQFSVLCPPTIKTGWNDASLAKQDAIDGTQRFMSIGNNVFLLSLKPKPDKATLQNVLMGVKLGLSLEGSKDIKDLEPVSGPNWHGQKLQATSEGMPLTYLVALDESKTLQILLVSAAPPGSPETKRFLSSLKVNPIAIQAINEKRKAKSLAARQDVSAEKLLPVGKFQVDVIEFLPSQQFLGWSNDLRKSISEDKNTMDALAKVDKKVADPLAKNVISTAEILKSPKTSEMLTKLTPQNMMDARTMALANLNVSKEGDKFTFAGSDGLDDFNGVELDLKSDVVRTSYGVTGPGELQEQQAPDGNWKGTIWRLNGGAGGTPVMVTFFLGRRTDMNNKAILMYTVNKLASFSDSFSRRLNYDIPPKDPVAADDNRMGLWLCNMAASRVTKDYSPEKAEPLFTKGLQLLQNVNDPQILTQCAEALKRGKKPDEAQKMEERVKQLPSSTQ